MMLAKAFFIIIAGLKAYYAFNGLFSPPQAGVKKPRATRNIIFIHIPRGREVVSRRAQYLGSLSSNG